MSARSADKCLQLCQNKQGCRWSTHDKNIQTCLLFKDCNHLDTTYSNATSSEINCKEKLGKDAFNIEKGKTQSISIKDKVQERKIHTSNKARAAVSFTVETQQWMGCGVDMCKARVALLVF